MHVCNFINILQILQYQKNFKSGLKILSRAVFDPRAGGWASWAYNLLSFHNRWIKRWYAARILSLNRWTANSASATVARIKAVPRPRLRTKRPERPQPVEAKLYRQPYLMKKIGRSSIHGNKIIGNYLSIAQCVNRRTFSSKDSTVR